MVGDLAADVQRCPVCFVGSILNAKAHIRRGAAFKQGILLRAVFGFAEIHDAEAQIGITDLVARGRHIFLLRHLGAVGQQIGVVLKNRRHTVAVLKANGTVPRAYRVHLQKIDGLGAVCFLGHIGIGIGDKHSAAAVGIVCVKRGVEHIPPQCDRVAAIRLAVIDDADTRRNAAAALEAVEHPVHLRHTAHIFKITNHVIGIISEIAARIGIPAHLICAERHAVEEPRQAVALKTAVIGEGAYIQVKHLILCLKACLLCPTGIGEQIGAGSRPAKVVVVVACLRFFGVDKMEVIEVHRLSADIAVQNRLLDLLHIGGAQAGEIDLFARIGQHKIHMIALGFCRRTDAQHRLLLHIQFIRLPVP